MLTVAQVSAEIGASPRTVRRICQTHGMGVAVNPRMRMLTAADVERIRRLWHGAPGNPLMQSSPGQRRLQAAATKAGRGRKPRAEASEE